MIISETDGQFVAQLEIIPDTGHMSLLVWYKKGGDREKTCFRTDTRKTYLELDIIDAIRKCNLEAAQVVLAMYVKYTKGEYDNVKA